jgi:prephenate dehydratase
MTDPDDSPRTAPSTRPIGSSSSGSTPILFGIQGGQGSFNEEAIQHYLKQAGIDDAQVLYLFTSGNVMAALQRGEINVGQCAIYNSVGGYVEETTSALEKAPVKI